MGTMTTSLNVDTLHDYLVWNNCYAINYTSHQVPPGEDLTVNIGTVIRRAPNWREMATSGGKYTGKHVAFIAPQELVAQAGLVGNRIPKAADRITDDEETVYTVLEADFQAERSTWKFMTLDLILAYGLYDTITLQRFPVETDSAGSRVYITPTVINSGVLAAIQEEAGNEQEEVGKRLAVRRFSVYVGTRLYPQVLDQVVDQNGNILEVVGWESPDNIDKLMKLNCEVKGWLVP